MFLNFFLSLVFHSRQKTFSVAGCPGQAEICQLAAGKKHRLPHVVVKCEPSTGCQIFASQKKSPEVTGR